MAKKMKKMMAAFLALVMCMGLISTTAFAKDECGWWDGKLYRSKNEANVYTPAIYPDGWERV